MPTDENNGVTPQNQQVSSNGQVDPNLGQSTVNATNDIAGNVDDFDFNFNEEGNGVINSVDSETLENQVESEGRTGMFRTPDEQLDAQQQTDSSVEQVGYSGDVNASTTMNTNLNETVNTGVNTDTNLNGRIDMKPEEEDSYLADIDPNDVQNDDNSIDVQQNLFDQANQDENNSQENLGEEIQSMISFDDDPVESNDATVESNDVSEFNDTAVKSNEIPNVDTNQTSENLGEAVVNSENNLAEGESNSDDWLKAEDKEVEESFGGQGLSQNEEVSDVDMSTENVAQNVENLITNQDNVSQQESNQYVPDENEYSKVSDLLNSSSAGQVDLNSLDNESTSENGESNGEIDNLVGENDEQENIDTTEDSQAESDSQVQGDLQGVSEVTNNSNVGTTGVFNIDAANMGDMEQSVGFGIGALNANSAESQNPEENNSVNLDSLIDQDIEKLSNVNSLQDINDVDSRQDGQQVTQQEVDIAKRKKQSGFKVLGIFFGAIILLVVLGVVATKMFPDKFNLKDIFGGGKVLEYIDNSGIINDIGLNGNEDPNIVENPVTELPVEGAEDIGMGTGEENIGDENFLEENNLDENNLDENNGQDNQLENNELDPNSIAGLLEDNGDENTDNLSGDVVDGDGTGNDVVEENQNTEEFDPFSEFSELIDENTKNIDALKNYISDGEFYKNLGITNKNTLLQKYGEYVMVKAQAALTNLENGGEIDTNLFSELDGILEMAENLVQGN